MEFCQEVTLLFVFFINIFCVGFLFEPLINQNKIYSGIKRCEFEKFEMLKYWMIYWMTVLNPKSVTVWQKADLTFPLFRWNIYFFTDDVNYFVGFNLDQRVSWWKYKTHVGVEDWGRNIIFVFYGGTRSVYICYMVISLIAVIIWW